MMSSENTVFKALIFNTAVWASLITALLYTAGWSFARRYFENFHLGLLPLEIPKEYYFIYSFWVLKHCILPDIGIVILLLAGGFLAKRSGTYLEKLNTAVPGITVVLVLVIISGAFWTSYKFGSVTATSRFIEQKYNDYPDYPRVKIELVSPNDADMLNIQNALKKGCYRLLLQNRDNLFLFYSLKDVPSADLPVVVIPLKQVGSFKILPHYNSCGD
jgi:hypothetical protein